MVETHGDEAVRSQALSEAAQTYRDNHHWVSLRLVGKNPKVMGDGWQKRTLKDPIPTFKDSCNIGILLGKPSGGLVRVDPDFPSVREVAEILFPEPTLMFGRESSPRSGRLYTCPGLEAEDFKLPGSVKDDPRLPQHNGEPCLTVLQLLATGKQTMAPPSVHPDNGEEIIWQSPDGAKLCALKPEELTRRAGVEAFLLAVCQFWPPRGTRNEAAMALARVLLEALKAHYPDRKQLVEAVDGLLLAVAMAGGDGKASADGKERAEATLRKMEAGEETTGMTRLVELLELPTDVAKTFRDWLGVKDNRPAIMLTAGARAQAVRFAMGVIADRKDLYFHGAPGEGELTRAAAKGNTMIPVSPVWLQDYFDNHVAFWQPKPRSNTPIAAFCPDWLPQRVIARTDEINVAELDGVITAPTMRADGSLLVDPGYDAATKLLLVGGPFPTIPESPTPAQLRAAWGKLWKPFKLFPFVTAYDRGVHVAALLTAMIRRQLATAPAFSYDAPQAGTGKTLLGKCILQLADGSLKNVFPGTKDEEEMRKRILSFLRCGASAILFDNIRGSFDSGAMEMLLTSEYFSDRVLGTNKNLSFRTNIMLQFSGNNFQLGGDLWRRILTSRINAEMDAPERRTFELRPLVYCRLHRQEMIAAGLTLMRGFIVAGSPKAKDVSDTLGTYEVWDARIRQCVLWMKEQEWMKEQIDDPINCVEVAKKRDTASSTLARFLEATHALMADEQWTSDKLVTKSHEYTSSATGAYLTDDRITMKAILHEIAGERGEINMRRLGNWLAKEVDKRHKSTWIERCEGQGHGGLVLWTIKKEPVVG
jgi:hypothetical protein